MILPRPIRGRTVPDRSAELIVRIMNYANEFKFLPQLKMLADSMNVTSAAVDSMITTLQRYELLSEGPIRDIKIAKHVTAIGKETARFLLLLGKCEETGFILKDLTDSSLSELREKIKVISNCEYQLPKLHKMLDVLLANGYLIEEAAHIRINPRRWLSEQTVISKICQMGLDGYKINRDMTFEPEEKLAGIS